MTETDLRTWLSIPEAAPILGKSTRTVERWVSQGKFEHALRPQEGTPPIVVLSPESVAEVAAAGRRKAAPFVLPHIPAGNGNGHARSLATNRQNLDNQLAAAPPDVDLFRQFLTLAVTALQSPPSPPVSARVAGSRSKSETVAESRLFLTIPDAAAVTGLSQAYLRRKCQEGWGGAFKDGRTWKLRRTDLETL